MPVETQVEVQDIRPLPRSAFHWRFAGQDWQNAGAVLDACYLPKLLSSICLSQ
ncbi:hypothetical protein HAX54_033690, partial [Datura stramonium]|nr:hypothetical protein [Datura stramonium]